MHTFITHEHIPVNPTGPGRVGKCPQDPAHQVIAFVESPDHNKQKCVTGSCMMNGTHNIVAFTLLMTSHMVRVTEDPGSSQMYHDCILLPA